MKETMFEVGQTVWCVSHGEGTVTDVGFHESWPIEVMFKTGRVMNYTWDGRFYSNCDRLLFFSKATVIGETKPQFVPKMVGKVVKLTSKANGRVFYREVADETLESVELLPDFYDNEHKDEETTYTKCKSEWDIEVVG